MIYLIKVNMLTYLVSTFLFKKKKKKYLHYSSAERSQQSLLYSALNHFKVRQLPMQLSSSNCDC